MYLDKGEYRLIKATICGVLEPVHNMHKGLVPHNWHGIC